MKKSHSFANRELIGSQSMKDLSASTTFDDELSFQKEKLDQVVKQIQGRFKGLSHSYVLVRQFVEENIYLSKEEILKL